MTSLRKLYLLRLSCRILIFGLCVFWFFARPEMYDILRGMNFFRTLSPLHLLWAVWVWDMLCQLFPLSSRISAGSRKLFKKYHIPAPGKADPERLRSLSQRATKGTLGVIILWASLLLIVSALGALKIFSPPILFLITTLCYVLDLVFVCFFCPLQVMMKNRCCTDCRIFNWDHLMMFSALLTIPGFFSTSLLVLALIVLLVWEISFRRFPERFFEETNTALRCKNCRDRLCGRRDHN